ncbi:MAG: hypothetical protein F4X83_06375 [Chloroflexi bacterium]|nr:hypothetical protein [Chloroflexota bacterium]
MITDKLPAHDLAPVLMGLYGEVGSILASAKKLQREASAYTNHRQHSLEEFGDALWYFAALARRLDENLEALLGSVSDFSISAESPRDPRDTPESRMSSLLALGQAAAQLLTIERSDSHSQTLLHGFVASYLHALKTFNMDLRDIMTANVKKTHGRFLKPQMSDLPTFDSSFPIEERLPNRFEIAITQRASGQSYLQWNGVFIGDPLTDNIVNPDGYRFHDVFHFAHAAILHWSPTFRALIKQKRKSCPKVDETQDGGRAIVVEEGLTAWIFSCAKHLDWFEGHDGVSFDLLKTISQFVQGYEVDSCPLYLWESAILQGYEVFRQVRRNDGGVVIGDRTSRTLTYGPLLQTST